MKRAFYPQGVMKVKINHVPMYAEYQGLSKGPCTACGRDSMCHTFHVRRYIDDPYTIFRFGETHAKRYVEVVAEVVHASAMV